MDDVNKVQALLELIDGENAKRKSMTNLADLDLGKITPRNDLQTDEIRSENNLELMKELEDITRVNHHENADFESDKEI